MREISLLLIGNAAQPEFAGLARELIARPDSHHSRDLAAALQRLQAGECFPELIIVLQARPGEFTSAELLALQQTAPLARCLILYGAWCEAGPRAGKPGSGRLEIAAQRWPTWWAIQLDRVAQDLAPAWARPVTTTPEETLWPSEPTTPLASATLPSAAFPSAALPSAAPKTIGILAPDRLTSAALEEACRGRGFRVEVLASPRDAHACDCVLWSARENTVVDLINFAARPWIALVDFPRAEDCERLLSSGAAAVFARPFDLDELFWRISHI